jgi:cytoskeleton protein RodZ
MDIGGELQRARTMRNWSLADIAERTKISPWVLRAIEANRFESVPGGLFARSFLRAYAREVDLDADLLVQSYRSQFEPLPAPSDAESPQVPPEPALNVDQRRGTSQVIGLAVVLLIGFAYVNFVSKTSASHGAAPMLTDANLSETSPTAVPVATSGALDTGRNTTGYVPLKIEIQATGPCWVALSADGERIASRLLNAGERQQFAVHDELAVRVGDPSAFTFTIDGAPGRSLGPAATPVNAQITRQNYKTFLAR